jgi:myo-inositol 2-dehydrogenase / D-chiro-inositol 1-dehydrogenase
MTINFALLGAGRIGKVHAQAINIDRDAALVAVADAVPEAAQTLAETYGCLVRSIDEIAADTNIDAIIIATPTNTHADLIEKFSHAGKAIFCEKPIDLDIRRVQSCLKTIANTNARLMVGFNRRFDPHFIALRQAVVDGRIGTPEMMQIISRDPGAPPAEYIKVSGGIFFDMTIHDFDMARFLLGEEIQTVFATASVLTDPVIAELGDFDSASVIMTTKSGKHISISNSRRATYGYDQRIEIHGSKGMIAAQNQRPVSIEIANEDGFTRPPLHDFFMTRYTQAYAAEISAFIGIVRDNNPPTPGGEDGLAALILAEAALKSSKLGRAVNVAEIWSLYQ